MKLFILNGDLAGKEFELKPPGLSLGRESDNDISLTGAAASRYHLKFEFEDSAWFLRDLNSTNGTKLNGVKINQREKLTRGDEVGVGSTRILFDDVQSDASKAETVQRASEEPPPPVVAVRAPEPIPAKPDAPAAVNPSDTFAPSPEAVAPPPGPSNTVAPSPDSPAGNPSAKTKMSISSTDVPPSPTASATMSAAEAAETDDAGDAEPELNNEHKGAGFGAFFESFKRKDKNKGEDQNADGAANPFGSINFFGNKPNESRDEDDDNADGSNGASKRSSRLYHIAVISLAVLAVLWILIFIKISEDNKAASRTANAKEAPAPPIMVDYTKEIVAPDNVFRYTLTLKPVYKTKKYRVKGTDKIVQRGVREGELSMTYDDLKNNVRFTRTADVPPDAMKTLNAELENTDFLSLASPQPGAPERDGSERLQSLTVNTSSGFNKVNVDNTFTPQSFQNALDILDTFAQSHMNLLAWRLTPEERERKAKDMFETAKRLYDNRDASASNLGQSIRRFGGVIELLDVFEPKPEMYYAAIETRKNAQADLDNRIKELKFNARQALRLNEVTNARDCFYKITQLLEDESDKDYQWARKGLLKTEELIKMGKK